MVSVSGARALTAPMKLYRFHDLVGTKAAGTYKAT